MTSLTILQLLVAREEDGGSQLFGHTNAAATPKSMKPSIIKLNISMGASFDVDDVDASVTVAAAKAEVDAWSGELFFIPCNFSKTWTRFGISCIS